MINTYSEIGEEISEYTLLARGSVVGWNIDLCEAQGFPFILYRAKQWKGYRPRFALAANSEEFHQTLQDLLYLGIEKWRGLIDLGREEDPLQFGEGLYQIPVEKTWTLDLWRCLAEPKDLTEKLRTFTYILPTAGDQPSIAVRSAKDLKFSVGTISGPVFYKAGTEFTIWPIWCLGGSWSAWIETGEKVQLKDERILDPDIVVAGKLGEDDWHWI